MTAWAVTSPTYPNLSLRLYAARLESMRPCSWLKCVLQVVEDGKPIATDPLSIDWRTKEELDAWIDESKRDGWTFKRWSDGTDLTTINNAKRCREYRERKREREMFA